MASILFLSGVWCVFLSPTTKISETEDSLYLNVAIDGLGRWSYSVNVQQETILIVRVDLGGRVYNATSPIIFSALVYDPSDDIVWSETNTTISHFHTETSKIGLYGKIDRSTLR